MDPIGAIGLFLFLVGSGLSCNTRGKVSIFWGLVATAGGFAMAINTGLIRM